MFLSEKAVVCITQKKRLIDYLPTECLSTIIVVFVAQMTTI